MTRFPRRDAGGEASATGASVGGAQAAGGKPGIPGTPATGASADAQRAGKARRVTSLSLRARVLAGLAAIALIATAAAAMVTVTTHRYLLRQVDEQLASFLGPGHAGDTRSACDLRLPTLPQSLGGFDDDEDEDWIGTPPTEAWRGTLCADGGYLIISSPTVYQDDSLDLADVSIADLSTTSQTYWTLRSSEGEQYRVVAAPVRDGWWITALPLERVEQATKRLIVIQGAGIGALLAGLGVVAWWVLRLGVTPMRRLVDASTRIADGDMDVRLDQVGGGKEAAELGHALDTMVSRLQGALAERERSEARLREFVADASHELRTPLTTVLGYAQLFRKGALARKPQQTDAWTRTEAEAARMKRLVEDMLDLARFDAEPVLVLRPVEVGPMLAEVVGDAGRAYPGVNFDVVGDLGDPGVAVLADPDRLRQAVINVVTNAAQHGASAVTVTVTGAVAGDLPGDSSRVRIAVADDGPGMAPEVAARATERFVRGDASRSRATGGAGLGLAITSAIVSAHGGELTIDSAQGEGTTVSIILPSAGE